MHPVTQRVCFITCKQRHISGMCRRHTFLNSIKQYTTSSPKKLKNIIQKNNLIPLIAPILNSRRGIYIPRPCITHFTPGRTFTRTPQISRQVFGGDVLQKLGLVIFAQDVNLADSGFIQPGFNERPDGWEEIWCLQVICDSVIAVSILIEIDTDWKSVHWW